MKTDPQKNKRSGFSAQAALFVSLGYCVMLLCAATPISSLKFTGDANANTYSLTNAATISATNFAGNAFGLTNFPSASAMGLGTLSTSNSITTGNITGLGSGVAAALGYNIDDYNSLMTLDASGNVSYAGANFSGNQFTDSAGDEISSGNIGDVAGDYMSGGYVVDQAGDSMNSGYIVDQAGDSMNGGIILAMEGFFDEDGDQMFNGTIADNAFDSMSSGNIVASSVVADQSGDNMGGGTITATSQFVDGGGDYLGSGSLYTGTVNALSAIIGQGGQAITIIGMDGSAPANTTTPAEWVHVKDSSNNDAWIPLYQ